MTRELLQQVRLLDPISQTDRITDVLIDGGVIRAIADAIDEHPADTVVQDCRGLILGPGLVDLYSHSGEPGFEDRESLHSLMQAASAGGFTRLAVLPDTMPVLDNPAAIAWLRRKAIETSKTSSSLPHLHCWAALTAELQGQQMTELAELSAAEVVGFADGSPLKNTLLLRRLLEYVGPFAKPIALWACDPNLVGSGVMREGIDSVRFGLSGIPAIAETTALTGILECVEATETPVHLMRVSTARSVELISAAKARGVPITASTTWVHLLLNSEAIGSYDSNLRLNPPLGTPTDQAALIQGLQAGVLDAIAIDHAPYTYEEKTVAFSEAPAGTIGLELALPLLWQALVESGQWSALELWRCLSTQPALCLQQEPPRVLTNHPAELTLFDSSKRWIVNGQTLKSRSTNTSWLGQEIVGRVINTWSLPTA